MRISGYLLLAAAAACLATVQSMPTEHVEETEPAYQEPLPSSGWGLASLDALAQRINDWVAPVVRAIEHVVENKTVTEVAVEARNATVQLAVQIRDSDTLQGAKEAISPLTRLFGRVHDRVKDKTLQQLAGDVQREIERLDQSVAAFIRGLGEDEEDQEVVEQVVEQVEEQVEQVAAEPEKAEGEAATVIDQAVPAENELEP